VKINDRELSCDGQLHARFTVSSQARWALFFLSFLDELARRGGKREQEVLGLEFTYAGQGGEEAL
jgi:hypothetical protein